MLAALGSDTCTILKLAIKLVEATPQAGTYVD
jgi:hypothetical protein